MLFHLITYIGNTYTMRINKNIINISKINCAKHYIDFPYTKPKIILLIT